MVRGKLVSVVWLVMVGWLGFGSIASSDAQTLFEVEGQLVQGTADGTPLDAFLPVQLIILTSDGEQRETFRTTAGEQGNFSFASVPRYEDGSFYVFSTQWAGIEQNSLPQLVNQLEDRVDFPVYELTNDLSDVIANRGNLRIEFEEVEQLGVQMLLELTYVNLGDRIVWQNPNTADAHAFTVELPVGALGVSPSAAIRDQQRYEEVSGLRDLEIPGIRDTQPLVPGWANRLSVSFFVPYEEGAVFDMRVPFSVNDVAIFVRDDTVSLDSTLFELSETRSTSTGREFEVYSQVAPLAPDDPFKFSLIGRPTETVRTTSANTVSADSSNDLTLFFGVGVGLVVTLVVLGLGIWFLRARQVSGNLA